MLHVSLVIPVLLAVTTAEKNGPDTLLRITCQLRDGSQVAGDVDPAAKLKLATGFGKLDVPLWRVTRIVVADDQETTKLFLSNGDRVTGFAETDGFSVTTEAGREVLVRLPNVRECTLRVADQPIVAAKVYASGAWAKWKPANAIDKNINTGWNSGAWNGWIELDLGRVQPVSRVRFTIAHYPPGRSQWNVYLSQQPIRAQRKVARLIKQVAGNFRQGSVIEVEFLTGVKGRYLQIHCPKSVSWVMIREIDVFAPKTRKKMRKPVEAKRPRDPLVGTFKVYEMWPADGMYRRSNFPNITISREKGHYRIDLVPKMLFRKTKGGLVPAVAPHSLPMFGLSEKDSAGRPTLIVTRSFNSLYLVRNQPPKSWKMARFDEKRFNRRLPRKKNGLVDLPVDPKIPKALGPEVLKACKTFLRAKGYSDRQCKLARIRWGMKLEGLLLLDVFTGGKDAAESARLVYSPLENTVLGRFFFGDQRG